MVLDLVSKTSSLESLQLPLCGDSLLITVMSPKGHLNE
jgi:hypothetical protein